MKKLIASAVLAMVAAQASAAAPDSSVVGGYIPQPGPSAPPANPAGGATVQTDLVSNPAGGATVQAGVMPSNPAGGATIAAAAPIVTPVAAPIVAIAAPVVAGNYLAHQAQQALSVSVVGTSMPSSPGAVAGGLLQ